MPGFWAAGRRWAASVGKVVTRSRLPWRDLVAMVAAAGVVGGSLWIAVPSESRTLDLTTAALHGTTLEAVRPSATGEVDPRLAAAVDAILARRGIAVRTNNVHLFLRDVAPELRPQQRLLFDNLRTIGMKVTYRRAEPWVNYQAVRRFGLATGTFRVTMRYEVFGTKLAQAATDVGYTYTVRQRRLFLVDDDDLDQAIGAGRQPWDFGRVWIVRRKHVLVIVNQGQLALARRLADGVVPPARLVRKVWRGPLQLVPVIVAMREPQVLTELPPTLPGDEPARVQALRSPASDGRPVGGWIVVRPGAQATFDSAQMTHVLMHLLPVKLGEEAPRWLSEGLARYVESRQLVAVGRAAEVAKNRSVIAQQVLGELTRLPADDEFNATDSSDISWLAVERLIKEVGIKPVTDYYLQVARRGYNEAARERLLREYTGLTEAALVESMRTPAG